MARSDALSYAHAILVATLLAGACDGDDASGGLPPVRDSGTQEDGGGDGPVREFDFGQLDEQLENFVADRGLMGMSAAIVDRDQGLVHVAGYGDFAADRVYAIGSCTKVVTAGVIMGLADQGVVDIDAPIGDYVGDLWGEGKAELTLAQLLSMSGGLVGNENFGYAPYACLRALDGTIEECAEAIYSADDAADRAAPDSAYRYSGPSFQLAGGVAIAASGKGWKQLVRETYGDPCGVASLGYSNFWYPGFTYPPEFQGNPDNAPDTENLNVGGGAYSNAEDYARLLLMHLRGGRCDDERVLTEEAVARMQVDRIGEVYGAQTGSPFFTGYGLGWLVSPETGIVANFGGLGSVAWLDDKLGYAVIFAMEADFATEQELFAESIPVLSQIFGGDSPLPPTPDIPELTTAACLDRGHAVPDACNACVCERCLTEQATCSLFEDGALCDEFFGCYWAHYNECSPVEGAWANCSFDRDGNFGQGPCVQEVANAAGVEPGADTAALTAACTEAPTINACAAMVEVRNCMQAQCADACMPWEGYSSDMDGGRP